MIVAGGMGITNIETILKHEGIKLVAVCDLYKGRLDQAKEKWGDRLFLMNDYKDILKQKPIDAVIIGAPDHLHKQISIDALKSGNTVSVEKVLGL